MSNSVLIVGGYGQVGLRIARALQAGQGEVVIAGRSETRAAAAAAQLRCQHATIDLEQPNTWEPAVGDCRLVVCCVDQDNVRFVRWVLENGRDYVDITASDEFFRQVEELDPVATESATTAVLSVGLAPGMTNLLVKECTKRLEVCESARIAIYLGLGERHGDAAVRWFLQQFARQQRRTEMSWVRFPNRRRACLAAPLDIADQYVVQRTLGLTDVRSVVTVESSFWTRVAVLLGPAFRWQGVRRLVEYLAPRVHLESEEWALSIEVAGTNSDNPRVVRATLAGEVEAEATARIAARVVELLPTRARAGVHHIEQLFDALEVADGLAETPVLDDVGPTQRFHVDPSEHVDLNLRSLGVGGEARSCDASK